MRPAEQCCMIMHFVNPSLIQLLLQSDSQAYTVASYLFLYENSSSKQDFVLNMVIQLAVLQPQFYQVIWLLQFRDYPSCSYQFNNVTVVKRFVGG